MDADVLRRGLDALGCKLDGRAASARTARRKRAAFGEVFNRAVERGYFERNPLNGVRWSPPAVNEEVDSAGVPNPGQVARLLAAVASLPGRGPHLEAFFGCMYYAAMRPAEVINLRVEQSHLPESGWGLLSLSGGVVIADKDWTDDGSVHEVHSLKRRAATATRPVPIVTWARAREYGLTRLERASGLAKRPYDLRRAGISFWWYSGVDPAECARRAGQSIEVLFRFYAKFLDGVREQANRLIEQSMGEWDRIHRGGTPAGGPSLDRE
ncbi:hypothetical protein [Streptomyces sp. NPDC052494]|uniref:hypothetical protein n=1 Tax=Streptomyces sp. NPDC052494 TaxID=3365692 RepID=UPI0037D2E24A